MNKKELVIGVLGGMGTYATLNLFKLYTKVFPAVKEWDRPRIIIDNRCTMPSRVRAYLYDENKDELVKQMTESMNYLSKAGANKIILACMTSHLFLPKIYKELPELRSKVVNLIKNCAEIVDKDKVKKVYILGSEGTIDSRIFQNELEKYNIECSVPKEEEYSIMRDCIEAVKQNKYSRWVKEKFLSLINGYDYIILGCTEMPILYDKYKKYAKCKKAYDPLELALKTIKKENKK